MKRFKAMIGGLLVYIKELGIAPATWQRSSPVLLDKGTTKLGPARFRLVHLLCPFGKAFFLEGEIFGDIAHTRVHEKSTLMHTAKAGGRAIGTTMTGFDASNAFMSVHHNTLDKLVETSFEDERGPCTHDAKIQRSADFVVRKCRRTRCGNRPLLWFFYKETSLALLFYNDVYSEQIAKWEHCCEKEDRDAEYLHAKCFFTGDIYDASSTIFC